jgi:hypothetical protein
VLFDTSSPGRKRVIRVVYSLLAGLFLIGFVGFGVGGNFSGGGILDALGITDSNGSSTSDAFSQQIDDQEAKLAKDPKNENALALLTQFRFQSGYGQIQQDDQGNPIVSDDAKAEFEKSVNAWERYIALNPQKPSLTAIKSAVTAYEALNDAKGAAKAQELFVQEAPKSVAAQGYSDLAYLRYFAQDIPAGDAAAKKAEAAAPKSQAKQVKQQLTKLRKQAIAQKAALAQQAKQSKQSGSGAAELQDPFGALGGGTGSPTGAAPTAP